MLFRGGRREEEVLAEADAVGEGVEEDIFSTVATLCMRRMRKDGRMDGYESLGIKI